MTPGRRNVLVVVGLVVAMVVAGWFLRTTDDTQTAADGASPSPSVSPSPSESPSPEPSSSPTETPDASPSPSEPEALPATTFSKVAFIGDSYAAGTGASAPGQRWTTLLSAANGWTEVNVAHPQTGYHRAGTQAPCAADTCPSFVSVVPQVVAEAPDLVIITGGSNDLTQDLEVAKGDMIRTLTELRAGLPNAAIVVVNPWWDMRPMNPALEAYSAAIREATAAINATYADTGQPLAGKIDLVTPTGLDANDAGQVVLADTVRSALRLAGFTVQ